ncbi:MAG: endonuclease/exonuclease/phosphatase family protein [Thermoleophilia bacterium]
MDGRLRIITWNVCHCRGGLEVPGADWRSTLLGTPRVDGGYLHLNRKHTQQVAHVLRAARPDVVMLQEVPPTAVATLARILGMRHACAVRTGPLVGSAAVRGWLGARNPDLWRTQEGNANALLLGPRLTPLGRPTGLHLNPRRAVLANTLRGHLAVDEAVRWITEPRRALAVRALVEGGGHVTLACVHAHPGRHPWQAHREMARLARWLRRMPGPAVLAGDLNLMPDHPALEHLREAGFDAAEAPGLGLDRVLVRDADGGPELRWATSRRTVEAQGRGRRLRVLLSDHDPVERLVAVRAT